MKILFYELRKLVSKKSFYLCYLLCFIFVLFFAYANTNSTQTYIHHKEFNNLIVNGKSIEGNYDLLEKRNQDLRNLISQKNKLNELFQEENIIITEDIDVNVEKGMSEEESLEIASQALHYIENIRNYKQYNSDILSSDLDNSIKSSYENIDQENIKAVNYLPIELINTQYIIFILSVFTSLFAIYILNNYEKDTNTAGISFLSNKGKQNLILSKFLVSIFIGISVMITFYLSLLIFNFAFFGLTDLYANIQSIPSCYESPFNITILTALLIGLGKQIIVIAGVICIYHFLFLLTKKDILSTTLLFVLLLIEFILYNGINDYSNLIVFRKWNIFNLASFLSFIDVYDSYLIFGFEMNGIILLCSIFIIIVSITVILLRNYSKGWINDSKLLKTNIVSKKGAHISLFKHEMYKQLILGKGWIIFIVLFLFCIYISCNFAVKMQNMNFSSIYNQYELYGGELTEEKIQMIDEKHKEIDNKASKFHYINKQYNNGEISEDEYRNVENEFMQDLYEDRSFENFYKDYSNRIGNSIVYPNGYQAIFSINSYNRDIIYSAFFVFISILLFSGLYLIDKDTNQEELYILTKNGRKKRISTQRKVGYIWIGILSVLLFVITFVLFYFVYPMNGWSYEMSAILRNNMNIEIINNSYLDSSILVNFVQLQIFRLFIFLILFELTLALSKLIHNRKNTVIIMLIIVLLPFLLTQIGFDFFRYISLIHLLSANMIFHTSSGFVVMYISIIYVGVRMIIKLKDWRKLNQYIRQMNIFM